MFSGVANAVTGRINAQYDKVDYYFHLKKTNDSLVKANESLLNRLKENYYLPDSMSMVRTDTLWVDSTYSLKRMAYISGKVVANSVVSQANYLVISGSNRDAFKTDMGITDLSLIHI